MYIVATVQTAAISQNCCGETAASIWGDVSVCLSQHSSLQAFHHHVVCLSSPPPPWSYSSHGKPPHLSNTPTSLFLQPTPPTPPLCALSGHPCLFVQMEQKRKWKPESTVNPFLGLCSTIVCIPVVFNRAISVLWWWFVPISGGSNSVASFLVWYGKK